MSFEVPKKLEAEADRRIRNYPQKRSTSMMLLHAVQDQFGYISHEAIQWVARKLDLQPINVYELVTFYPMFRPELAGKHEIKVCRTLPCALGGARELHGHICRRLGLEAKSCGLQTTRDGQFSVEFVECLAGCGAAPVMMCGGEFFEKVTLDEADAILESRK